MLLATMFSLGRLSGDNEITAMKASGISLYRILMPIYIFSLCMGFVVMTFTEYVVPRANLYRDDILSQGNEFKFTFSRNREMDRNRIFLSNGDGKIIYAHSYITRNKTAQRVFIIEPLNRSKKIGIKSRIDARYMTFSNGMWELQSVGTDSVVVRTFTKEGEVHKHFKTLPAPFIVRKPSDFARIDIEPEEMDYFQLRNYINEVKAKGEDASEWLVDLFLKISFPFVSFVIVFFGAPIAVGSVQRGKTASFGIALMISFLYYSLINTCHVLGRNGAIHPFVAAWFPNGFFLVIGLFILVYSKK